MEPVFLINQIENEKCIIFADMMIGITWMENLNGNLILFMSVQITN